MNPYAILGLDDGADERAIRRAYAQALRGARPDEDPEAFQRLNEAYRAALELAQRAAVRPPTSIPVGETRQLWSSGQITLSAEPTSQAAAAPVAAAVETVSIPQLARTIVETAGAESAPALRLWLQACEPLYLLDRKSNVAYRLVQELHRQPPMPADTLEVLKDFFDLGTIGAHPSSVQAAFQSLWLASQFDYDAFLAQLKRRSRASVRELNHWLQSQHPLNDASLRQDIAVRLHGWLMDQHAFHMDSPGFDLLARFFAFPDAQLLSDRNFVRMVIATENTDYMNVRTPTAIRQLKRRFDPMQAILMAIIPGMPTHIARVAERLAQRYRGVPDALNFRQYQFFMELTRSSPWNPMRWAVVALRTAATFMTWLVVSWFEHRQLAPGASALVAGVVGLLSAMAIFIGAYGRGRTPQYTAAAPSASPPEA